MGLAVGIVARHRESNRRGNNIRVQRDLIRSRMFMPPTPTFAYPSSTLIPYSVIPKARRFRGCDRADAEAFKILVLRGDVTIESHVPTL